MLSQYTTKCKYTFKIIQIIAKLDQVLNHILNMNQDYTISITIEKFDLYDFTKKSR
jgi:hypothetical protein